MPLILPPVTPQRALLWLINWQTFKTPLTLTMEERVRAESIHHPTSQARYVKSRAILRQILSHYLQQDPDAIQLIAPPNQKPRLQHNPDKFAFNVAHSGDWVWIGLCQNAEIGVDLESAQREFNVQALAKKLKMPAENPLAVLSAFSAREAILKCSGQGLRQFQFPDPNIQAQLAMAEGLILAVALGAAVDISTISAETPRFSAIRCSHTSMYAALGFSKIKSFHLDIANCQQPLDKKIETVCVTHELSWSKT